MRIVTLVENSCNDGLGCAHGLSLYVETAGHNILFDAGPDGELLLNNAEKLGIDLKNVDIAILSHGHYDHAGGLINFLELNSKATLYIHKFAATRGHFATEKVGWRNIGIDERILREFSHRLVLTEGSFSIDDELFLFSDIYTSEYISGSNSSLFEEVNGEYIPDPFYHEQNLIIRENDKITLLAGCAHRGIINIIKRADEICEKAPDNVFAGFHLTNPGLGLDLPEEFVISVGKEMKKYPSTYFTGHCTGINPYSWLKTELGDRLKNLCSGLDVTV